MPIELFNSDHYILKEKGIIELMKHPFTGLARSVHKCLNCWTRSWGK